MNDTWIALQTGSHIFHRRVNLEMTEGIHNFFVYVNLTECSLIFFS